MHNALNIKIFCLTLVAAVTAALPLAPAFPLEKQAEELAEVGLTTKLGAQVDLTREFTTHTGKKLKLRELFQPERPVFLVPAYYSCPHLCGLVLEGVSTLLNRLALDLGREFEIITVSFDPDDTTELAEERAQNYHQRHKEPEAARAHWHFLSGTKENIDPVMQQIGYHFKPDHGEFAHGAAVMILTPEGKVSQYFTGIQYSPFDVRLALIEASKGAIGSPLDHLMLFCFRFDETKGRYTWAAFTLMRIGGLVTVIFLGSLLSILWRKERRARRARV